MDNEPRNAERSASEAKCRDANNRYQLRMAASAGGTRGRKRSRISTQRKLRVLIVDKDRDATDALSALVTQWGHDARSAYDAATCLAMASTATPDVVLLDTAMPELDGCELAVQLHKDARLQECFLIAVTNLGDEDHRQQCHASGIDLFLVKPVDDLVMKTLLMLERQRLGLSLTAPILTGDDSIKFVTAQKVVLV